MRERRRVYFAKHPRQYERVYFAKSLLGKKNYFTKVNRVYFAKHPRPYVHRGTRRGVHERSHRTPGPRPRPRRTRGCPPSFLAPSCSDSMSWGESLTGKLPVRQASERGKGKWGQSYASDWSPSRWPGCADRWGIRAASYADHWGIRAA